MPTRDSMVWWLLMIGAVVGYLATVPVPSSWSYEQWMNAVLVIIGIVAGKLATSPLAGTPKDDVLEHIPKG